MTNAFGTFQNLSRQTSTPKSTNPAEREDEAPSNLKETLTFAQHGSGEAMQRSLMQLQRTIGNQAVNDLVSQRSAPEASVQRVIEMESSGLPKLSTLFDDAFAAIAGMVDADFFNRYKTKLPADHPVKNKTFLETWAIKTMRPTLRQGAAAEFSTENIDFLLAVESYKEAPSADKAINIYNTFISEAAATQVNLSAAVRGPYDEAIALLNQAPATRGRR